MRSRKTKLACADFAFPLLPHDGALDLIRILELPGVDVGLFEGRSHLQPSTEFENADRSGRALRRKLEDRGLEAADVFLQMDTDFRAWAVNHPEPGRRQKARDWFERTLDYAEACGAGHVTTLPGVVFDGREEDSWSRCRDELAWRLERAGQRRIAFAVEAHIGSIAPDPETAGRLVKEVPGLTLTLDYTHFARHGIDDARVEPLIEHASHFHVRGAREGRLQSSFKDNAIDYGRVVEAMDRTGYDGWIGIEYTWIDWEHCNEVDNLSETILFRDFLREKSARTHN